MEINDYVEERKSVVSSEEKQCLLEAITIARTTLKTLLEQQNAGILFETWGSFDLLFTSFLRYSILRSCGSGWDVKLKFT
jgi:hypothetical protein